MLIEGSSRAEDGRIEFRALATVSYDDVAHTYHFRAFNEGHYLDTELTVVDHGFSWGFEAGPAKIVNTMRLTGKGEWAETTETTVAGRPAQKSVDMLLQHAP